MEGGHNFQVVIEEGLVRGDVEDEPSYEETGGGDEDHHPRHEVILLGEWNRYHFNY